MYLRPTWFKVTTPSTGEVVSPDSMRQHLRVSVSAEASILADYIRSAVNACEQFTKTTLLSSPAEAAFPCWPTDGLVLPLGPVSAITAVSFRDSDDVSTALDLTKLILNANQNPARVFPIPDYNRPSIGTRVDPIRFTYTVGYASKEVIPALLLQGIRWYATWAFENRHPIILFAQANSPELPKAIRSCWQPYRDEWF